jgi:hypothetical protein
LAAAVLVGCGGGSEDTAPATTNSPTTGSTTTPPATTPPATTPPASANTAPVIAGTATATILAGSAYSFTPTASDANGNALTFSIQNQPAWTTFSTTTGALTGMPAAVNAGTYSNIIISVSDGMATTSLAAFAVTVTQSVNGSATLSWIAPTQNTNGSALTNLTGYRIYYGTNSSSLSQSVTISTVGTTTYMIGGLGSGTWYFAIRAYNASGVESDLSNLASKTIA